MLVKEEKVNLGRQREFDLVKALAIFFMVIIHVYEELANVDYSVACTEPFDIILQFLGGPLAAPVFMFAMGLGISYSSHREPKDLIKRGIGIFFFAYLLNIIRYTIPEIITEIMSEGIENLEYKTIFAATFFIDILSFAGLTFIFTGLFKKWKVPVIGVVIIALFMQAAGFVITSYVVFHNVFTKCFFGLFVKSSTYSYFPFFQWYLYPALGLLFAKYLRHIEDTDKLYGGILLFSAAFLCAFLASLSYIGYDIRSLFTLADELYYNQSLLHTIFSLLSMAIELSLVHFLLKVIHLPKLEKVIAFMSSNLNNIYIVQWIIIGWLEYFIIYDETLLEKEWVIPMGLLLVVVSTLIVLVYKKIKTKKIHS